MKQHQHPKASICIGRHRAQCARSLHTSNRKRPIAKCGAIHGSSGFSGGLVELGKLSGHAELATVPWALWGHSGGGHWAGGMVMLHPERVADAWLRSGVPFLAANPDRPTIKPHTLPKAALGVPMMCNPGTKEGVTVKTGRFARVWPMNETFFKTIRGRGGLLGMAIDPLSAHECGNQRYLAIPWLDTCLTARLPAQSGQPLKPMPTQDAWLAPLLGDTAVPAAAFIGDNHKGTWLPNKAIAQKWMQYVTDTKVIVTPAPKDVKWKLGPLKLIWKAAFPISSLLMTVSRATAPGCNTATMPLAKMEITDNGGKHGGVAIEITTMAVLSITGLIERSLQG